MRTLFRPAVLPLVAVALTLSACAAKPQLRPEAPTDRAPRADQAKPQAPAHPAPQTVSTTGFDPSPIYYELDSATLTEPSQRTLSELAEALRRAPGATIRITGHTCELGTTEYNLALGLRRAAAARDHLVRLGVGAGRIDIISYGEEHPAMAGHEDGAHRQNRRSEFNVVVSSAKG